MFELLIEPFVDYLFMRRALVGSLVVSLGAVPVGVFMTLRRMSLTGDAMAHAILPGAAIAYLISGLSLLGLTIGGVSAGLIVASIAGLVARSSHLNEDTSLAAFYLLSLASGVMIISLKQSNIDLFHLLFGNILALDKAALLLLASISSLTVIIMAGIYRPLVIECADPTFLRRVGSASAIAHYGFLFLMVINLVAGFHALGTLMAIGIMVLPATAARFWAVSMDGLLISALLIAGAGCYVGLLLSFHFDLPSGPSIIISVGIFCIWSILFGSNGSLLKKRAPSRHLVG